VVDVLAIFGHACDMRTNAGRAVGHVWCCDLPKEVETLGKYFHQDAPDIWHSGPQCVIECRRDLATPGRRLNIYIPHGSCRSNSRNLPCHGCLPRRSLRRCLIEFPHNMYRRVCSAACTSSHSYVSLDSWESSVSPSLAWVRLEMEAVLHSTGTDRRHGISAGSVFGPSRIS